MTNEERQLLTMTARHVTQLFSDRDDMVIGVTAVLLDLYRVLFAAGRDSKEGALARLRTQHDEIDRVAPDRSAYLGSLIKTLEDDQLNAAELARQFQQRPPAGTA